MQLHPLDEPESERLCEPPWLVLGQHRISLVVTVRDARREEGHWGIQSWWQLQDPRRHRDEFALSLSNTPVLNIKESTSALKGARQCGSSPSWDRGRKVSADPGNLALSFHSLALFRPRTLPSPAQMPSRFPGRHLDPCLHCPLLRPRRHKSCGISPDPGRIE